jgi:hypothetical protein
MSEPEQHATEAIVSAARRAFLGTLLATQLRLDANGVASIADKDSKPSRSISAELIKRLGAEAAGARLPGQTAGTGFESAVAVFLQETFPKLGILRCGTFQVFKGSSIDSYEQYEHLAAVARATNENPALKVALGRDYLIKPDVVVVRLPETDAAINGGLALVDETVARLTSIRLLNNQRAILHASVSCKWTLRSDRAQNARSEALNLIRNRKGRLPHTAVVTAEPTPGRIGSLALGTGDIDCVYHIALHELRESIEALGYEDSLELLDTMIEGKRLRDISDLPLDLAV